MNPTTPPSFSGLRVATFESRLSGPIADLIAKYGGVAVSAPSLREVPLGDNAEAFAFANRLVAGEFDLVLFLTGVGTRYLAQAIEERIPRAVWTEALARAEVVIRGPKPLAPLRELGVRIDLQAPEPNTWHEVLSALDANLPVAGLRVAVQEYGETNPELIAGLEQRGAIVTRVPVYRWALPEDTGPLRRAIAEISDGHIGVALFTSAQQVEHLLRVAGEVGRDADLRAAFSRWTVVGSVGPTTSETLRRHGLPVDVEPAHPKMGQLVAATAAEWTRAGKVPPTRPESGKGGAAN
jgi:uroporphyrinogen-III synthase